ncbi:MAG: ClcB-like voltage-gated chloride channel protein [Luteolibacter sp.]
MRARIWLGERMFGSDLRNPLIWAAVVGFFGAWISIGFKEATDWAHALYAGSHAGYIESFMALAWWQRLLVPALGGLLAGLTLHLSKRFSRQANSTDYMEAVVVGDGNLGVKSSLVKSTSAWLSASSGASIGREGPLVLLAALGASIFGRVLKFPLARKRLIVACGAAAGIASAYNAPIAGAFFVAEIVLGSLAMESFGPLVISSVVATLVTRQHYGAEAMYSAPVFTFQGNHELLPYLMLGLACGVVSPWYLGFLKGSEVAFSKLKLPPWARLALGGLIVGALAIVHPEVTGNGRGLVFGILHHPGTWQTLAVILLFKVLATGATFGSGAVGGVFTPTLFAGAAVGYLFGVGAEGLFPGWNLQPGAFGLVGMGAFLAATTAAPVMAIIMLFELTLNYQILPPLMLASVVGYYVCRSFTQRSLYKEALARKGAAAVAQHLSTLRIGDLMQEDAGTLAPTASFGEIAKSFLRSRHDYLHVVDESRYLGAICLHDIKSYLDEPELESLVIAQDVMRDDHPCLRPDMSMAEALDFFGASQSERLPVTDEKGVFLGVVTKTDVWLFLAGKPRKAA